MSISEFFSKIFHFFESDKAKKIAQEIHDISLQVIPLVKEIDALIPNRTAEEIIAAYEKYGLQNVDTLLALPQTQWWQALLNIGVSLAQVEFPALPLSSIVSGVTLAVSVIHSSK